ncbi:MAG: VCBS repeat-containing protein [Deltaproteobacteria bacterium]|nr:VCBS repeat-containing protein [Deltaproteobacteria bacterium]
MKRRLCLVNGLFVATALSATGLAMAAGGDTWPTLAHDQSRTSHANGKGAITAPQIAWKYQAGGSLAENQVAEADVNGDDIAELVFVSAGRVVARTAGGKAIWVSENFGAQRVIGVYDLDATAPAEVIVAGESPLGAYILSAATGATLWYEPTISSAFDLLAVPVTGGFEMLLANQLGALSAYQFAGGVVDPATNKTWENAAAPWSVDMAMADVDGDGKPELVRGRDRGFVVHDLATGAVRCDASSIVSGTVAPMYFPAINVADVDGDGRQEVIIYDTSYYYSEDAGIFVVSCNGSGATLTTQVRWQQQWITDTDGLPGTNVNDNQIRFLADAVTNYDNKPGLEMVFSLWDKAAGTWTTSMLNAVTGVSITSKVGEVIEAVADLDDDGMPEALLREATGMSDMPKPYFSAMRLYNLNVGAFNNKGWTLDKGRAATINARRSQVVTAGAGVIGARQNTDGPTDPAHEVYIFAGAQGQGADDPRPGKLLTVKGADGTILNEYDFPATISGTLINLNSTLANASSASESLVMLTDGGLRALDASLVEFGKNTPGNFAHLPSVVSINGTKNVVIGMTSPGHMVALDGTILQNQQPALVWKYRDAIQSESRGYLNTPGLLVPDKAGPGSQLLIRAHKQGAFEEQSFVALGPDGTSTWTADLGNGRTIAGFENFELLDDLDGDGVKDFFLTEIEADGSQQLVIRKGSDGLTMVKRATGDLFPPSGVYLQGHAAVDLNADGKLDVVSALHGSWFVGIDVSQAGTGDPALGFQQIFRRNAPANGQAMVGQLDNEPELDLLRVNSQNATGPYERRDLSGLVELSVTTPHPNVALTDTNTVAFVNRPGAPGLQDFVWAGMSGDALGALSRVDGDTFTEIWFGYLAQGQVFAKADKPTNRAALYPPVAADIDGDGEDEVIVGSEDGHVYALRATDGTLAFSIDLGAPVVHVIPADIDKDPELELIATVADGTIVALDEQGKYTADTTGTEPQPEAGPETGADATDALVDGAGGSGGAEASTDAGGSAGKAGSAPDGGTDAAADGQAGSAPAGGGGSEDSGGCGCRTSGSGSGSAAWMILGLLMAGSLVRRKR